MKKLIKAGIFFGLIFLMTGSAWALPAANDVVTISVTGSDPYYVPYLMTNNDTSTSATWDEYYSFCLESHISFSDGGTYTVQSVEDYATSGGIDAAGPYNDDPYWVSGDNMDYISDQTKWLFVNYFDDPTAYDANIVQSAIWWLEDEEGGDSDAWKDFFKDVTGGGFGQSYCYDYTSILAGWNIQAVNLIDENGTDIQSQLVGEYNPVPEPATMVLFGIGLLGLAGMGRKRKKK